MVLTRSKSPAVKLTSTMKDKAAAANPQDNDDAGTSSEAAGINEPEHQEAANGAQVRGIVEAIILAFSDKRLVEERLAPALGPLLAPALAPALHDCFMMELQQRDDKIKHLEQHLQESQSKIEELEQYSRRNCLVVHGVKETPGENTDDFICKLAKEKLEVDVEPTDIDRSHRLGEKGKQDRQGRTITRPIIVKFAAYRSRAKFYGARSKLKKTGIFIHENLTTERQKLLKKVKYKYPGPTNRTWTQDGRIKVKTDTNRLVVITTNKDWEEHIKSLP